MAEMTLWMAMGPGGLGMHSSVRQTGKRKGLRGSKTREL